MHNHIGVIAYDLDRKTIYYIFMTHNKIPKKKSGNKNKQKKLNRNPDSSNNQIQAERLIEKAAKQDKRKTNDIANDTPGYTPDANNQDNKTQTENIPETGQTWGDLDADHTKQTIN